MKFENLSFVAAESSGGQKKIVAWQPIRTNDHSEDCRQGRAYFREMQAFMKEGNNTIYLCRVLSAQVAGGVWGGVEIGFAQALAEAAVS